MEQRRQSQYIPIDRAARVVRIDVGNEATRFDLELERWIRVPSVLVQLVALAALLRTPRAWRSIRSAVAQSRTEGLRGTWRGVRRNILLQAEMRGMDRHAAADRADELIAMTGLRGFEKALPHELSGGMQQRVALCRALIHEPALLLMDEPFGALDELTRMEMNDLLLEIRARTRATVVFVTHSIHEAVYLSDQVLVFSRRPSRIVERLGVDLAYPRSAQTRFSPRFTELAQRASRALGVLH